MAIWSRLFSPSWKTIAWDKVTQIDVARIPTLVVEDFYVILYSGDEKLFQIGDFEKGYQEFLAVLLKKWPQIEIALGRVFTGPPDIEEHATLWKREG